MLFSTRFQCRANREASPFSCRTSLSLPVGLRSVHQFAAARNCRYLRWQSTTTYYASRVGVRSPDIVKIDIEGAEPKALAGMGALIRSEGASDIAVEINSYVLQRSGLDSGAITVPLVQAGYALYRFEDKGLRAYNPE
jgi:hypothetical protein